jgi:heptosyltransferase-2
LRRVLLTHALPPPEQDGERIPISMIERYLRVTRALGCADAGPDLDLVVDAQARGRVATRLAGAGLDEATRIVVVTPGAAFGASKLWPAEHFATACDRMAVDLGLRTVLAPGPGEEDVARSIAEQMSASPLLLTEPVSSLPELAALIQRAALLLSNDTGPRHMAVALGVPAVTVMGPTDPRHTEHLMERQRVLREPVDCSPCHLKVCPIDHRCMTRLDPDRAVAAAAELLS